MKGTQLKSNSNPTRSRARVSWVLSLGLSLTGLLLIPPAATAEPEELKWARVDFLSNRVQLVPREQRSRHARIADVLSIGDALRTARASRAELRFNDGSLARIGERATFRFTPNTRNFQLSNGTVLLLIPPGRGRSTIQTPNAVTGIQGSALFVRYIPETDTTIVGALTDNPDGPMILFNEAGTESQALRSNEIGVIEGDQITQIYQFDGALFWQSSGLAEGFDYLSPPSQTGDPLDGVRQEIQEALSNQRPLDSDGVIENPDSFSRPAPPVEELPAPAVSEPAADSPESTTAAVTNASPSETSAAGGTISAPETTTEPVAATVVDTVTATEAPAASDNLDLEVALDLELDLDLEADGGAAPNLDINETVQQYLNGDIANLSGSSDLEVGNSLQTINANPSDADGAGGAVSNPPTGVSDDSGTVGAGTPAGTSETPNQAPEAGGEQTVTSSSTAVDGSTTIDPPPVTDNSNSEGTPVGGANGESGSGQLDSNPSSNLDSSNGGLPPGATIDSSIPPNQTSASTSSAVIAVPTVPDSQDSSSSGLLPQVAEPVTAPETVPTAIPSDISPSDIPSSLAEETVPAASEINVIDLSPALDQPPVELFLPTDKVVDDLIMMHDLGDGMDHNMATEDMATEDMATDNISGDMNSPQP